MNHAGPPELISDKMDSSLTQQMQKYSGGPEEGIALSSEIHTLLFCHDEEIISQFQAQISTMTQHISSLEEKLRDREEDCDFVRNQLYDSEIARYNEAHSKVAFQRHLRLEQHRNNSGDEAYRALQLQHGKTTADLNAANTFNAMLQQEIEHSKHIIDSMARTIAECGQEIEHNKNITDLMARTIAECGQEIEHNKHIIDSMARKIAEYEHSAQRLTGSQQDDGSKSSLRPETGSSNANAAAGSPGSLSPGIGGAPVFIDESPRLSSTGLGTESQKRLLNGERKATRPVKAKARAKVEK